MSNVDCVNLSCLIGIYLINNNIILYIHIKRITTYIELLHFIYVIIYKVQIIIRGIKCNYSTFKFLRN